MEAEDPAGFPGRSLSGTCGMPITIREARIVESRTATGSRETYGEYPADLTAWGRPACIRRSPSPGRASPKSSRAGSTTTAAPRSWCCASRKPVGFAVVQRSLASTEDPKRIYRRPVLHHGSALAAEASGAARLMLIFARYAGEWTVAEQSRNPGAIRCWRRRLPEFTNGRVPGEARAGRDRAHSSRARGRRMR